MASQQYFLGSPRFSHHSETPVLFNRPATTSSFKPLLPLADRTNIQTQSTIVSLNMQTPNRLGPTWSETIQHRKNSLEHLLATGRCSSDEDEDTSVCAPPSSESKAAIICQNLRGHIRSEVKDAKGEHLPDFKSKPSRNLNWRTTPPVKNLMLSFIKSEDTEALSSTTPEVKKRLIVSPKNEPLEAATPPKVVRGPSFSGIEEVICFGIPPPQIKHNLSDWSKVDPALSHCDFCPKDGDCIHHNTTHAKDASSDEDLPDLEPAPRRTKTISPVQKLLVNNIMSEAFDSVVVPTRIENPCTANSTSKRHINADFLKATSSVKATTPQVKHPLITCPKNKTLEVSTPTKGVPWPPFYGVEEVVGNSTPQTPIKCKIYDESGVPNNAFFDNVALCLSSPDWSKDGDCIQRDIIHVNDAKSDEDLLNLKLEPRKCFGMKAMRWPSFSGIEKVVDTTTPPTPIKRKISGESGIPNKRSFEGKTTALFTSLPDLSNANLAMPHATYVSKEDDCINQDTIYVMDSTCHGLPNMEPGNKPYLLNAHNSILALPTTPRMKHPRIGITAHAYRKCKPSDKYVPDWEDDELEFPLCDTHLEDEALCTAWYREFTKHRHQMVKQWKECSKCWALHMAYRSAKSVPESGCMPIVSALSDHEYPSTSQLSTNLDSPPKLRVTSAVPEHLPRSLSTPDTNSCDPIPKSEAVEVISITDSDDDTLIIELPSNGEDLNTSLKEPSKVASIDQRVTYVKNEIICISDDDTQVIDLSLSSEESEVKLPPVVSNCAETKTSSFSGVVSQLLGDKVETLLSPKLESPSSTRKNFFGCLQSSKSNLITNYFHASPKTGGLLTKCKGTATNRDGTDTKRKCSLTLNNTLSHRKPRCPQLTNRNTRRKLDMELHYVDSSDELQAPRLPKCDTSLSSLGGATSCEFSCGIDLLVYNCIDAKGPHLPLGLQLISDCCTAESKPSRELVSHLLTCWRGAKQIREVRLFHETFMNLQRHHKVLHDQKLRKCLSDSVTALEMSSDPVQLEANSRLVEFVTCVLEDDLDATLISCRDKMLSSNVSLRQSLVYKWFDPGTECVWIRTAQQWMAGAVIRNHSGDAAGCLSRFISCISRLLEMAFQVCTNHKRCAKSMANNFCSIYAQIPLWVHRKVFIDFVRPALLQSTFLATLLEERASRSHISKDLTRKYLSQTLSIAKITRYFFLMGPLSLDSGDTNVLSQHLEDQHKELLFLKFHLLRSYLEAIEEPDLSNEMKQLLNASDTLKNLEKAIYLDCPALLRNFEIQHTLTFLKLIWN